MHDLPCYICQCVVLALKILKVEPKLKERSRIQVGIVFAGVLGFLQGNIFVWSRTSLESGWSSSKALDSLTNKNQCKGLAKQYRTPTHSSCR
jgi:hypothetical protein